MTKFWISLVIGVILVLAWMGGRQEAAASMQWPSVPGVITDFSYSPRTSDKDGPVSARASVKYSYSVNGTAYQGDRFDARLTTDADTARARYPKGAQVTVFYNPRRPQDALLERGGSGSWLFGLGGVCCLFYAGYVLFKRLKRNSPGVASVSREAQVKS